MCWGCGCFTVWERLVGSQCQSGGGVAFISFVCSQVDVFCFDGKICFWNEAAACGCGCGSTLPSLIPKALQLRGVSVW